MQITASEMMLVDGYNVIYAWPELVGLTDDLALVRDKLIDIMAGYGAYKACEVLLVFDAHATAGSRSMQPVNPHLTVVYTGEGETADSYIERAAYDLVRQGGKNRQVYVVTSDRAEQTVAFGAGALRISARELHLDIKTVDKLIQTEFFDTALSRRRHELQGRLDGAVLKRLKEMRKGR